MSNMPVFSPSDLGAAIRRERKARGQTQEDLARRAGCRRETIIAIEAGDNISTYTLMAVLGALGKGLSVCDARIELDRLSEIFGDDDDSDQQAVDPYHAPRRPVTSGPG